MGSLLRTAEAVDWKQEMSDQSQGVRVLQRKLCSAQWALVVETGDAIERAAIGTSAAQQRQSKCPSLFQGCMQPHSDPEECLAGEELYARDGSFWLQS